MFIRLHMKHGKFRLKRSRRSNLQPLHPMPQKSKGKKAKSEKEVRFLLSKGTPLSEHQRQKLLNELHSGRVKIRHSPKHKER